MKIIFLKNHEPGGYKAGDHCDDHPNATYLIKMKVAEEFDSSKDSKSPGYKELMMNVVKEFDLLKKEDVNEGPGNAISEGDKEKQLKEIDETTGPEKVEEVKKETKVDQKPAGKKETGPATKKTK